MPPEKFSDSSAKRVPKIRYLFLINADVDLKMYFLNKTIKRYLVRPLMRENFMSLE